MTIDPITADGVVNLAESQGSVTITGTVGDQWMDGERALRCACIGPVPLGDSKSADGDSTQDKMGLRVPCRLMLDTDILLVDRTKVGSASNPDRSAQKAMALTIWEPDPKKKYAPGERLDGKVTIAPKDSAMRIDAASLQAMADEFNLEAVDFAQDIEITMEVGRPVGRIEFTAEATCKDGSTLALRHPARWTFSRSPSVLDAFAAPVSRVPVAMLRIDPFDGVYPEIPDGGIYGSDGWSASIFVIEKSSSSFTGTLLMSVRNFTGHPTAINVPLAAVTASGRTLGRTAVAVPFAGGFVGTVRWTPASDITFTRAPP